MPCCAPFACGDALNRVVLETATRGHVARTLVSTPGAPVINSGGGASVFGQYSVALSDDGHLAVAWIETKATTPSGCPSTCIGTTMADFGPSSRWGRLA